MILEYTFADNVPINKTSKEVKYYATEYNKTIQASSPIQFQINDVQVPESGEAVLRLGLGREHGKTLRPKVLVNGTEVVVPANFRGDDQKDRDVFFGVIEIDVPVNILQSNNTIAITFPESGGHVSSVAMQVFTFNGDVERSDKGEVSGISVTPSSQWLPLGGWVQLTEQVYPTLTENKKVSWRSSNEQLATVSETGMVKAKNTTGTVTIYATTEEGSYTDSCIFSIEQAQPGSLTVDDKNKYKTTTYYTGGTIEVTLDYFAGTNEKVTRTNGGVRVLLRHLDKNWKVIKDWSFSDSTTIGTNKGTAKVIINLDGVPPTSELQNGDFYFLFPQFQSTNGDNYNVNGLSNINIVESPTGIIDLVKSDIKVYPNPAKDKLIIENSCTENYRISIYNLQGIKLMTQNISGEKTAIDISKLASGFYILKTIDSKTNKQKIFQKF